MVATTMFEDASGGDTFCWNLSQSIGKNLNNRNSGDALLVQYLMHTFFSFKGTRPMPYPYAQIDGIWGPKSQAALALIETQTNGFTLQDGRVDPMPFEKSIFHGSHLTRMYKLFYLQWTYVQLFGVGPQDALNGVAMGLKLLQMPRDGVCPRKLALVLNSTLMLGG